MFHHGQLLSELLCIHIIIAFAICSSVNSQMFSPNGYNSQINLSEHPIQTRTKTYVSEEPCPPLSGNLDKLSQEQFSDLLTDSCRYERRIKPATNGTMNISMQIDMRHIEAVNPVEFRSRIVVTMRYQDPRLRYDDISPNREFVLGEESLRNKIWVPHIIIRNERDTALMGMDGKDVFVLISPLGDVIYSYRMTVDFYCFMDLQKFPFDSQICDLKWVSWKYNVSNLVLKWQDSAPFQVDQTLQLPEFILEHFWIDTGIDTGSAHGALVGDFSALIFKFKLYRQVGYYMLAFFIPSALLVFMSWVSFWLQADATPARTTLGSATMMSFITLNVGLSQSLPKVSYIKASEIWFLGCACFIFCSLAEFAFVNVIWRRRKMVELKKQNSINMLKGAITPSVARNEVRKAASVCGVYNSESGSPEKNNSFYDFPGSTKQNEYLVSNDVSVEAINEIPNAPNWTIMEPQEVAIWIDRKSRVFFPVCFLVFNVLYWFFVYIL